MAATLPIRAGLGKSLGGTAPYGYQWVNKKLIPHPTDAPVRRLVHELFAKHKRIRTVTRLLNEGGHRKRGKLFSASGVEVMLRDPTPKGLHRANYITWDAKGKKWINMPESEWVWQPVEPIIDAALWDAGAAILKEHHDNWKPPTRRPVQLFAGLLFCGCGDKMYVPSNMPKYVCRKCRAKIPIDDLEDIFITQLKNYMLSPEEFNRYLHDKDEELKAKEALVATVQTEAKTLKADMYKLYELYSEGGLNVTGFRARNEPLQTRWEQVQEELPKLEATVDYLKVQFLSSDQIMIEARSLATFWPDMDREAKRLVVEGDLTKITLNGDELSMELCYLPTLSPPHKPDSSSNPSAYAFASNMATRHTAMAG